MDVLENLAAAAADAKANVKAVDGDVVAGFTTVKTDIKGLIASRLNDLFLVMVVLGSIWIGHAL